MVAEGKVVSVAEARVPAEGVSDVDVGYTKVALELTIEGSG